MTSNEKWKIAILEELGSRSMSDIFEKHIKFPCIMLSSVEEKGFTKEEIICPYCFEKTKIEYETQKKNSITRECKHCHISFENNCCTSKEETKAFFTRRKRYYHDILIFTRANICDEDGILYVQLHDIDIKYSVEKRRVYIKPNVRGFGFAYVGGRYRYIDGKASRARTVNYSSYYTPDYFADNSFLEYAKEKGISNEQILSSQNIMRIMFDLEKLGDKIKTPGRSVLVRKASGFIEENPIKELPNGFFDIKEYLVLKLRKIDNLTKQYYYNGYCNACGSKYSMNQTHRIYRESRYHKCPKCGKGKMNFVDEAYDTREYVVLDVFGNAGLTIRVFRCTYEYKQNSVQVTPRETDRIYLNYSKEPDWDFVYVKKELDGFWKMQKMEDIPYVLIRDNLKITSKAKDFLKYTGLQEYIKANRKDTGYCHEDISTKSLFNYLYACRTGSCLEKIAKVGWNRLCTHYSENITKGYDIAIDQNGRTLHEVLKLPKRLVNYITDHVSNNPNPSDISRIQMFYDIDSDVMSDDLDWCETHSVEPGNLKRIVRLLNISIHQAVEYLERVRVSQCFLPKSAVIEWYDYLDAAENIQADLSDKTVRYPSSLKREHDRAAFKYKVIKDKNKEECFKKVCKKYGEQYSYESNDFQIMAPKDMQDLFEEGRRLNHCVGSYADRITDGRTCICFIRRKAELNEPFFTVEIDPDEERVRQIHGLSNRNVDRTKDKDLFQFLKKWAKAKKININAM